MRKIYTRKMHESRKRRVEILLRALVAIARKAGLKPSFTKRMVGKLPDGSKIDVRYTAAAKTMHYFMLKSGDCGSFLLNMQFNPRKVTIDDSTRFRKDGRYLSGHIQCWHDEVKREVAFVKRITGMVKSASGWKVKPLPKWLREM